MQALLFLRTMAGAAFLFVIAFFAVSPASSSPASSYSPALRRYPYLTDLVGAYATINWGTDRSESSGGVRYGKVGSESCTAHYVAGTKTAISVNSVLQYQWKAQLRLEPGARYCYRVYLGTSPFSEIDLLGSDPAPTFWTQVPGGSPESFSFIVIGDWGQVSSSGVNTYQADLMSLIAASGARFAVTTGDNGYPSGNQKNFGDLIQVGADLSAVFGPAFWKAPGASMAIFPSLGNHGFNSSEANHPQLITWPQDRAVALSGGRFVKETYCCLNGSTSRAYPSLWYAFDAGPARFYVLNAAWQESNVGTASEYEMDYDYHWADGTPQYEWLKADLAAHPSILKFAFFHYPIYSDNPNEPSNTFFHGSSRLEGLLKQHSVDIAFTGHAHIYERNLASAAGVINYVTGGGGATLGTLGTCTALDAYAIKFTSTGKACGSALVPTGPAQVFHFLKVTVNGSAVTVTPINSLGQSFDVMNYSFTAGVETISPSAPANLTAAPVSGTQINLSWSPSSDDSGVRGYGIFRDGVLVNTVDKNILSYADAGLTSATAYTYQVDAFDGSGNHSALSSPNSATTQSTATYVFTPVADAYVSSGSTNTKYGLATTLRADASPVQRSYLRFHVGDTSGSVTRATLRLYTTSSSSTGYDVRGVIGQAWEEGTIAYTNAPAVDSVVASSGNIASGNWTSVDVTSLITGNGIYDLALTTATSTTLIFNSRDASSNQPQLVIETSAGGIPPTPTHTPTPTVGLGNVLTFITEADARVVQSSPGTNYGTSTSLQADGNAGSAQTSFIRFHASGISDTIQTAKLRVFCTTNGTSNGPAAYLADNNWIESGSGGISWDTQPALLSSAVDNKGAIGTSSWVEYDVTSLVAGDGIYSFALVADSTDGVTFSAREGTIAPQLAVTLMSGTATAISTVTETYTPTATWTATSSPLVTATFTLTPSPTASATGTATATSTPTVTQTPTITASLGASTTLTYTSEADTRVSQSSPTTNYGSQSNLLIAAGDGAAQTGYIRFTVSGISGSVQSATLRVFCTGNGTSNGPAVYLAGNDWIEKGTGGMTWNSRPALLSGATDNKGAIGTDSWVEYHVTALVTGDGTYTFALVADSTDGVTFSSREGTSPAQLAVTIGS